MRLIRKTTSLTLLFRLKRTVNLLDFPGTEVVFSINTKPGSCIRYMQGFCSFLPTRCQMYIAQMHALAVSQSLDLEFVRSVYTIAVNISISETMNVLIEACHTCSANTWTAVSTLVWSNNARDRESITQIVRRWSNLHEVQGSDPTGVHSLMWFPKSC